MRSDFTEFDKRDLIVNGHLIQELIIVDKAPPLVFIDGKLRKNLTYHQAIEWAGANPVPNYAGSLEVADKENPSIRE